MKKKIKEAFEYFYWPKALLAVCIFVALVVFYIGADNPNFNSEAYVALSKSPTIDAMPVVRCKDCEHYGWEQEPCHGKTQRFYKLHKGLVIVDRDSFCSYGKRRCDNDTP